MYNFKSTDLSTLRHPSMKPPSIVSKTSQSYSYSSQSDAIQNSMQYLSFYSSTTVQIAQIRRCKRMQTLNKNKNRQKLQYSHPKPKYRSKGHSFGNHDITSPPQAPSHPLSPRRRRRPVGLGRRFRRRLGRCSVSSTLWLRGSASLGMTSLSRAFCR